MLADKCIKDSNKECKKSEGVYFAVPKRMFDMMTSAGKENLSSIPKEFYLYNKEGKLQKLSSDNSPQSAEASESSKRTMEIVLIPKAEFKKLKQHMKKNKPSKEQYKNCKENLLTQVKNLSMPEGYPTPEKIVMPHKKETKEKIAKKNRHL